MTCDQQLDTNLDPGEAPGGSKWRRPPLRVQLRFHRLPLD